MSSSATASGPTSFTPAVLRQPITAITNKVEYPSTFVDQLNRILNKSINSYTNLDVIDADYVALKTFVDPAPPPDSTGKQGIVIGRTYSCRSTIPGLAAVDAKVTDIDYTTKEVMTVSPTATNATTATVTKYRANRCTPKAAAPISRRPQRGGQTTPPTFPTKPFKTGLRSLTTLLEQLQQEKATRGLPVYDTIIKVNQDRAAQQQALIDNVRSRVEELITAETGRLRTGLTAINDVLTKYTTEKTSAEVPAKQFDDEIAKYTDLLSKARTRMGELMEKSKAISSGEASIYMGGGRGRRGRGTKRSRHRGRKGTRRSA
jgi:hypothetical protein